MTNTPPQFATEVERPKFTKGPWEVGYRALEVRAGPMKICDIRGWGYLTGKGEALALPEDEAIAIQTANANLIASAPRMYAALEALLERYRIMVAADGIEALEAACALKAARGTSHD